MTDGLIKLIKIERTHIFDRELKKLSKKHYPIKVLSPCLRIIIYRNITLLKRIKDYSLHGNWKGYREFHPARYGSYGHQYDNWIVIYKLENRKLILTLIATGGHQLLSK